MSRATVTSGPRAELSLPLERRITDFVFKMLGAVTCTPGPMQYLGAKLLDLGIVREQAVVRWVVVCELLGWRGSG